MRKMGVTPEMTTGEALELFPQLFPAFAQLGICCVNPENENLSIAELCAQYRTDTASFVEAVNALLG